MGYPSSIASINQPSSTTNMDDSGYEHDSIHDQEIVEIEAIETAIGVNPTTIDDTVTPTSSPSTIANFMDMVAAQLKAIGGAANWYTSIPISLATHIAATVAHGLTGNVVGDTDTQTLENKTISTGSALDANADPNFTYYSMARQAIINGNFNVWQRANTSTNPANTTYIADRWLTGVNADSGTLPTSIIHSRQALTAGDIANAFYFYRVNPNGAGTSLGVNSYAYISQRIENGTRFLSGNGKKVTLSFWARSSISNKRITPTLTQYYGSGGSPSSTEYILGTPITLTSTWTKYTVTFTTNTLVGKTFGTNNDDYLECVFWYVWGSTLGNTRVQASVTAETFGGSGNIDIAQVQVCAGNVALPFQPKSFVEELKACQRYYEQSYNYGIYSGAINDLGAHNWDSISTNFTQTNIPFQVEKRNTPSIVLYSNSTGSSGKIRNETTSTDLTAATSKIGVNGFAAYVNNVGTTLGDDMAVHWTAEAEL